MSNRTKKATVAVAWFAPARPNDIVIFMNQIHIRFGDEWFYIGQNGVLIDAIKSTQEKLNEYFYGD